MKNPDKDRGQGPDQNPNSAQVPQAGADQSQLLYASILAKGMYLGLGILLVTFFIYLSRNVDPGVPIAELPNYWSLSAHEYHEAINHDFLHRDAIVVGWGWVAVLGMGDFLNFIGIALLSAVTIVCYMGILPGLFRKKDWIYATIAAVEVIILVLAASGKITGGHLGIGTGDKGQAKGPERRVEEGETDWPEADPTLDVNP